MDASEILTQEYNNLWAEKLVHKQGIRKFHNYLTYITAIGSLALAFHGLNAQDVISAVNNTQKSKEIIENASSILHLFFIPFSPVLLITLTFPLNDMFHIYTIGNHIGKIESKINQIENKNLLLWEHQVCPKVYGGNEDHKGNKISNIIRMSDVLLLIPALLVLGIITTSISTIFIYQKLSLLWAIGYVVLVAYMFGIVIWLALKLNSYTSPEGKLTMIIQNVNELPEIDKSNNVV